MIAMFDSVDLAQIPANAPACAGYVGGRFPTYAELVRRFPKSRHLSIAVNAEENAECLDIENGDAVPEQAPAWTRRQIARGVKRPAVYGSVSAMPAILGALGRAGITRQQVRVWTAHYTFTPHLCGLSCGLSQTTADATQWTDKAFGRNLDESVCRDSFFSIPVPDPYARFPNIPLVLGHVVHERDAVKAYDALMRRPHTPAARAALLDELVYLRKRVWALAHRTTPPRWSDDSLGWRWQQLHERTK